MNGTTALVIDDHPLLLEGVKQLFDLDDGFELIGATTDPEEGVALARRHNPDIVLLDLNMGKIHGLDVLKRIKALKIDSLVIVLTVSNAANDMLAALRLGADGYLLKDMEPEEILAQLGSAGEGKLVLTETVATMLAKLMREEKQQLAAPPSDPGLTQRESEILGFIAQGMSNKSIGRELNISDGTVKVHVKNLLRKLNAKSRLEAAIWALGHGYEHPAEATGSGRA